MATKKDLIDNLTNKLSYLNYQDALIVVNTLVEYLTQELSKGNRIELRGFGSLSIRSRKYPENNKHYNTVYYRMSKQINDYLNNKKQLLN